jgi:hypothetical protein
VLVPSRLVPADFVEPENPSKRPAVSDKPAHVFEREGPFQVVENSELHLFIRSSQLFRAVPQSELRIGGDGKVVGIEIENPAKLVDRDGPNGVDRSDEENIFGSSTNSSWSGLEEATTSTLLRHAENRGKRGGNER